jgi:hypothetical protein
VDETILANESYEKADALEKILNEPIPMAFVPVVSAAGLTLLLVLFSLVAAKFVFVFSTDTVPSIILKPLYEMFCNFSFGIDHHSGFVSID